MSIGCDDSVAWDEYRHRIPGQRSAYRSGSPGFAKQGGNLSVSVHIAERDIACQL